jgi:hypothetical protein
MKPVKHAAFCAFFALAGAFGVGCSSPPPATNSFSEVYDQVIVHSCASAYCHYYNVGIRYSALDMSSQTIAYWNLVEQPGLGPSCSEMGTRVVPGDPNASLFYQKVAQEMPSCGSRMPADPTMLLQNGTSVFSGTPIPQDQQQLIYDWISAGAQND